MPSGTFTQQLDQVRRKARLSGRPVTKQEVSGVAHGQANEATNRLAVARNQELREQEGERTERLTNAARISAERQAAAQLAAQREMAEKEAAERRFLQQQQLDLTREQMAEQTRITNYQMEQAEKASKKDSTLDTVKTIAGGAMLASELYKSDLFQDSISWASDAISETDWSWLCTEIRNKVGFSDEESRVVDKLRRYVVRKHKNEFFWYLNNGSILVAKINAANAGHDFYTKLKKKLIDPIISRFSISAAESAYEHYVDVTRDLVCEYAPELYDSWEKVSGIKCACAE